MGYFKRCNLQSLTIKSNGKVVNFFYLKEKFTKNISNIAFDGRG
jgi:hypothetical protein